MEAYTKTNPKFYWFKMLTLFNNNKEKKQQQNIKQETFNFYGDKAENGYLSNFYAAPVEIEGNIWPTTEHYFQAMKFPTRPDHRDKIRNNKSPFIAKRLG